MNETVSINEINQIRQEFKQYLKKSHMEWQDSTATMHYSDAFYAFNNNVGENFWAYFVSDESLLCAKDDIRKFIEKTKGADNAAERSNGYYSSMKYFKRFLEEEYPTLAAEWSQKTITGTWKNPIADNKKKYQPQAF